MKTFLQRHPVSGVVFAIILQLAVLFYFGQHTLFGVLSAIIEMLLLGLLSELLLLAWRRLYRGNKAAGPKSDLISAVVRKRSADEEGSC